MQIIDKVSLIIVTLELQIQYRWSLHEINPFNYYKYLRNRRCHNSCILYQLKGGRTNLKLLILIASNNTFKCTLDLNYTQFTQYMCYIKQFIISYYIDTNTTRLPTTQSRPNSRVWALSLKNCYFLSCWFLHESYTLRLNSYITISMLFVFVDFILRFTKNRETGVYFKASFVTRRIYFKQCYDKILNSILAKSKSPDWGWDTSHQISSVAQFTL